MMRRRNTVRVLVACVLVVLAVVFLLPDTTKDRCDFPVTSRYFWAGNEPTINNSVISVLPSRRPFPPLLIPDYPWKSHSVMARAFTQTEHDQLLQLTESVVSLLESANVTYMMSFGTLLGSYIFGDVIPWDDDLDLLVDVRHLASVRRLLADPGVRSRYAVHSFGDAEDMWEFGKLRLELDSHELHLSTLLNTVQRHLPAELSNSERQRVLRQVENEHSSCLIWRRQHRRFYKAKVSARNAGHAQAGSYNWTWPFVDLIFYEQRGDQICSIDYDGPMYTMCQPLDVTFPLRSRPLGRLWLPAPSDTRAFLRHRFPKFACQFGTWDHRNEHWHDHASLRHSCDDLLDTYPVLRRKCLEHGVRETLSLGQNSISTLDFPFQPCPADTDPFSLK